MIIIRKSDLSEETVSGLIRLSELWAEENCSHGIVPNTADDLKEPAYVALDGDRIIGYIFGHFYTAEKRTSYIEPGSRCFYVDELYVLPEFRSRGIGRQLFAAIEDEVEGEADYVTLSTSTKDWMRTLKFYTQGTGMDFHSAFLIKRTKNNDRED